MVGSGCRSFGNTVLMGHNPIMFSPVALCPMSSPLSFLPVTFPVLMVNCQSTPCLQLNRLVHLEKTHTAVLTRFTSILSSRILSNRSRSISEASLLSRGTKSRVVTGDKCDGTLVSVSVCRENKEEDLHVCT